MLPQEAVVAGSPGFVDALLPPLSERLGGAPRVADSPGLAAALCQDGARLLVYEHGGREWLSVRESLQAGGADLVVVAAVPPEHAPDVADISAAASAVVAWNGDGRPVMEAVARVLAAREAPRVEPARPPGPMLTPQPRSPGPVLTPQPRSPGPVLTPQPRPPAVGAAPVPAPAVPRAAAPATRPSSATPPPAARPRPVMTPSAPMPAAPPVAAAPAPAPQPAPDGGRFEAIFDEEDVADVEAPAVAGQAGPAPYAPVSTTWPGSVLGSGDGLAVVRAALSGLWPEQRLRPVTEKVVESLSTAEKAAALGHALPFDADPVRRAVGLRWQVAAVLETLPPPGTPVDPAAVQAILSGIDDALAGLKVLSDDAGPDTLRALETVRHALVKEAIDLTEALQRVAPPEVVDEITTSRKARRTDVVAVTRIVHSSRELEEPERRVPWGLVVLLVIVMAAGAAYHGWRYVNRAKGAPQPVAGAPSGTVGAVTARGKVIVTPGGVTLDPREVESFKNLERAKGNEVKQLGPQTFLVVPAESKGAAPPPEPQPQQPQQPPQGAKP